MAHIRKRKFNTKNTYPEQKIDNDLCMSVRAGNLVFLRGQVGQTLEGTVVHVGDAGKQTDQAMRNVKFLLEEQGSRLDDICKITVYLVDRGYRDAVYQSLGKWLKGVFPVSTGLVIDGLARPEYLMEIDVFAVIPEERMPKLASGAAAKAKARGKAKSATGRRKPTRRKAA
ncbi:MAG: RidA family protein [Dongiaceae bacterium]